MKNLEDIWGELKFGDIVLFQEYSDDTESSIEYSKPELVTIVGYDIWDMAIAVHYVSYKTFDAYNNKSEIKVQGFGEWTTYWNILGHWKSMPDFKTLLNAYRQLK